MKRLALLAVLFAAAELSAVTLENEAMKIVFGEPNEAFPVREIVNKKAGNASFLHATKSFPAFWGIRFVRKEAGTNVFVHVTERRTAAARDVKATDRAVTFQWKGLTLPGSKETFDVAARVVLPAGDAMSTWSVQVRNRSERWTVYEIQYPFLDRVVAADDPAATVLTPSKANVGGRLLKMSEYGKKTKLFSMEYPSDRLQMCALMTGDAGLYIAAHDPECRSKVMTVAPDGTVWFETLVENAGIPGKASGSIGYAVTVGAFKGDWWTAAHIYRDWALKQRWAKKGKIAFRADFPRKPLDAHIWIIGGGHTNSAAYTLEAMNRAWPDVGKNLTWSEWAVVGGGRATNRNNPEFFPVFEGTGDLAARASKAGFFTSLYVNGRIWDKATCGFEYAQADATKKSDGTLHNEDYHSWDTVYHFAVMCPTCPTWQKVMRDLSVRCLDELNMDGVYFDQVACSTPKACYDPAHGHPLGGGRWWEQGYRAMFEEIRRAFTARGATIISEQMGEMWLDLIDVYLNGTGYTPYDVPLFPAVYSGYMLHYGRPVPLDCDAATAFREYARTLVWGEAFGWIVPYVLWIDRYRDRVSLIHRMARMRRDWKEFLVTGTLEDEVRFAERDPDVFGTVYKNAVGDREAAFVVNAGKSPKTVRFRFAGAKDETVATVAAQSVIRVLRDDAAGKPRTKDPYDYKDVVVRDVTCSRVFTNAAQHAVVDFGRDAVGWLEVGGAPGTYEIVIGEMTNAQGRVTNPHPGSTIRVQTLKGEKTAGWFRPPMTPDRWNLTGYAPKVSPAIRLPLHLGLVFPFRYAEIVRLPAPPAPGLFVQKAVNYPIDMTRSAFTCSDEALTRVYDFCKYSVLATSFTGIYVDGDRERTPYEADAYINQLAHYAMDDDYSMARRSFEWLMLHPTWPTEWKQHMIKMAWADWMWTGDTRSIAKFYASLRDAKLMRPFARASDGLLETGGENGKGAKPGAADIVDWPASERNGFEFRPVNAVVNAFYIRNLEEMRDMAAALGRHDEARAFAADAVRLRAAYQKAFFDEKRGLYVDGEGSSHVTVQANAAALAFSLVPPERVQGVADWLVAQGMACSTYFAQYLLEALFVAGRDEAAIALMTARGDRGWLGMMDFGSTITMESWNMKVKPNQDLNHAWSASPLSMVARFVLGVTPLEPGFAKVSIRPQMGKLASVAGTVPTAKGPVRVEAAGGVLRIDTPVPARVVWQGRTRQVAAGHHVLGERKK